jgi:electron transfer flavoprotein beta subunit
MRIVVLVKQILDPAGITVRRDKERIFVNREDYIIDPASRAAIEAALRLKDLVVRASAVPDEPVVRTSVLPPEEQSTVTAISVGPARADDALREALAMGCDAALLASDPAFANLDISGTVDVLAAAVQKLGGANVIVAGREAADTGSGQVGSRLAGALGYGQVTDVYELAPGDGLVRATRRWRSGFSGVEAPLPVVVTVAPEAFVPRYAPGARIMSAYRDWEVTVWNAQELELAEDGLASRLAFRTESFPPPLEAGEVLRGDPAGTGEELVMVLRQHRLVR